MNFPASLGDTCDRHCELPSQSTITDLELTIPNAMEIFNNMMMMTFIKYVRESLTSLALNLRNFNTEENAWIKEMDFNLLKTIKIYVHRSINALVMEDFLFFVTGKRLINGKMQNVDKGMYKNLTKFEFITRKLGNMDIDWGSFDFTRLQKLQVNNN